MNIENIASFVVLNQYKNYQKAADALYISQPTLTYRIKSLEKEIGWQLVNRSNHNVKLTEQGRLFLPYAIEISKLYAEAKNRIQTHQSSITICSVRTISLYMLPALIGQFRREHPSTYIHVLTGNTAACITALMNGKCEVAIAEAVDRPDVTCIPVIRDPIILCATPESPLFGRETISLRELAKDKTIACNTEANSWPTIKNHFAQHDLSFQPYYQFDTLESLKSTIAAGNSIGFLPQSCVHSELITGELVSIPFETSQAFYRDICVIYRQQTPPPFLDFIVEELQVIWKRDFVS